MRTSPCACGPGPFRCTRPSASRWTRLTCAIPCAHPTTSAAGRGQPGDRRERPGSITDLQAYRRLSLWWDTLPGPLLGELRAPLDGDVDADVAIVGAGYTGLWTAYYLAKADPSVRVVVVEKETAGFGASGRNGGWCSALFPASWAKIARSSSREDAIRMQRAMFD